MGAVVVLIPCVIVIAKRSKDATTTAEPQRTTYGAITTTQPPPTVWNASDYQSSSDFYNSLPSSHNFNQLDNLRLDRLSSPRFHPSNGTSMIYLRRQYHMPDLRGSTTTLHWLDLETNTTVQLTRPIWGIHDQQVRRKYLMYFCNGLFSFIVLLGL